MGVRGPMGMVRTFLAFRNFPWCGDVTKELMRTFDVDYVIQNNSTSYIVQLFAMPFVFSLWASSLAEQLCLSILRTGADARHQGRC